MRVVVSAGSRVPEKGLLGDGGSEAQVACRHTQSMTQLSPEEREGRRLQPHGWALPPCWERHSPHSTAGLTPHKAAAEPCGATAFFPCPHGAEDGYSGLG